MYASISPRNVPSSMFRVVAPAFLAGLYEILNREDPSIICWCDDGLAFAIHDSDALVKRILPAYFRHSKFASFQRQLNYFGFRKRQHYHGCESSSVYCAPHFVRYDPMRMLLIKRKTYRAKGFDEPPTIRARAPLMLSLPEMSFSSESVSEIESFVDLLRNSEDSERLTPIPYDQQELKETTWTDEDWDALAFLGEGSFSL
ncbi:unnamed protein product [Aphanomyces euteiches]|uniref:HSF-type DNA-binding domain-containing protein n=1 Tax=Aphanomyces euteiches TaxID=100861 RepID=A0A6G0XRW5_9STRA|nr:hypothetical protein Ae201684_002148 [Aphanomyces euteiches]KAH9087171.1 hypothetical protein Ae201684P_000583 [Aphanomyces euteiches]KAH9132414.1 hypothetical protein AeRB84_021172 [Aphanomyces euteiches]